MKRSELYDRIWSTPASKVAAELGISGSRVAAICRRHSIPTPPRGHWAKWAVGKPLPRSPLLQPEADYEPKLGRPQCKPSARVAPGVLIRPGAEAEGSHVAAPASDSEPSAPEEASAPRRPSARTAWLDPEQSTARVNMELVQVAAAELQGMQAVRELLQAVAARAVHASPDDAQCVLTWVAAVRAKLEAHDPVAVLLRLAAEPSHG